MFIGVDDVLVTSE